ncbi:MAG: biotin/lipoyl-containing protein [Sulfolobales archaeon]
MSKTYSLRVNDKEYTAEVSEIGSGKFRVKIGNKELIIELIQKQLTAQAATPVSQPVIKEEKIIQPQLPPPEGSEVVTAPVPGKVVKVLVSNGDLVKEKSVLLTLESMKMELEITASVSGVVKEVRVRPGDSVNVGDILVIIGRT